MHLCANVLALSHSNEDLVRIAQFSRKSYIKKRWKYMISFKWKNENNSFNCEKGTIYVKSLCEIT